MALSPSSKFSEQPFIFEEPKVTAVPTQPLNNPFDDDVDANQHMLHTESSLDGYEHDNTIQLQLQHQLVHNLNVDDEENERDRRLYSKNEIVNNVYGQPFFPQQNKLYPRVAVIRRLPVLEERP